MMYNDESKPGSGNEKPFSGGINQILYTKAKETAIPAVPEDDDLQKHPPPRRHGCPSKGRRVDNPKLREKSKPEKVKPQRDLRSSLPSEESETLEAPVDRRRRTTGHRTEVFGAGLAERIKPTSLESIDPSWPL